MEKKVVSTRPSNSRCRSRKKCLHRPSPPYLPDLTHIPSFWSRRVLQRVWNLHEHICLVHCLLENRPHLYLLSLSRHYPCMCPMHIHHWPNNLKLVQEHELCVWGEGGGEDKEEVGKKWGKKVVSTRPSNSRCRSRKKCLHRPSPPYLPSPPAWLWRGLTHLEKPGRTAPQPFGAWCIREPSLQLSQA